MDSGIRRLAGGALALALLAVGAAAWTNHGQDPTGGSGPNTKGQVGSPGTRANHPRFTIPFAQSLDGWLGNHTETAVKVINDSDELVDVRAEWYYAFGGFAGTSGPIDVPPHESRMLFTQNFGEDVSPFYQYEGFRDTTDEFSGFARIFVGPNTGSAKNVAVQAMLLTDLGGGQIGNYGINARTSTELHVNRVDDADGDGIDDTRFKGD